MSIVEEAGELVARWRRDAIAFVRREFHVEPDRWQTEGLKAWVSPDPKDRRIALQACAGPGKSALLAWFAAHFLVCQSDGESHPNGFAVSITSDNLRDGLWKELAVWYHKSDFMQHFFEWQKEQIFARHHPSTWWLRARTFSKTADQEAQGRTLSGLHSPFIAYFIDESGDMPASVGKSAEQGLGNCLWGKIAQAGNPTSLSGMLYESVNSGKWRTIRITGDPDNPDRSPRIDLSWAKEQIEKYGRENAWVMAYVLGLFPPASLNALLGPDEVRDAMTRHIREESYSFAQKRLGIDVARFGDDSTVIWPRQGLRAFRPVQMRGARTDAIAARVMKAKADWGSEMELIDNAGGWAAGVIDFCLQAGVSLYPVNPSGNAVDPRYFNLRSEVLFNAAEFVKKGGVLPNMPELIPEITAATYTFEKGKFRVLEKAQIKVLLNGRSPDYWDAFCQTFALPDMPASLGYPENLVSRGRQFQTEHEYDPFARTAS